MALGTCEFWESVQGLGPQSRMLCRISSIVGGLDKVVPKPLARFQPGALWSEAAGSGPGSNQIGIGREKLRQIRELSGLDFSISFLLCTSFIGVLCSTGHVPLS